MAPAYINHSEHRVNNNHKVNVPSLRRALVNRNYAKLWYGQAVSAVGNGCGSSEVSWLRCEDESVAVSGVVDAFVLAAEVEAPVGVEVAAGDQGAEFQDGLGAFEPPPCARYVHSVLDEPACRALDYPGGNGPAFLQRGGVAEVVLLVVQVAGGFAGAGAL